MPLKKAGGPVVGLDIGTNFIKACEIEVKGGKASLRGIAVLPTPTDAVVNGEIVDPVSLGKTIKQVLAQAGIKARKVVTCVAGQSSLVVRIIEVPKMTRAELQETMKWEIERHVPFAAEQVVMDYQPLTAPEEVPDGQNMEVLLAVAQEALVTRHVEAIQAAGLSPLAIDIESLATSRSLLDLSNGAGPAGTVAIVDLGASTTDISIYRDGRIAFTRSIQLAGNNLTKAIADVLGQPLAEAERLKKDIAAVPQMGSAAATADTGFGMDLGLPTLDFGSPDDPPLGGTFGTSPATGSTTATDTQSEPDFDIAGQGFSPEAFTSPSDAAAGSASPFDIPGGPEAAAPAGEPAAPFDLTGPAPVANPFDPDAAPVPEAQPAASANPFDSGALFGPTPSADPFAPLDDLDSLAAPSSSYGGHVPDPNAGPPAAMTEEEYLKTQIADAVMPVLHELVTELRRSLDFYRNRANGLGAQQVMICGGTAKLPGLAGFLSANLDVPVAVGNPLEYVLTGTKSDPQYLQDVGPFFPVSVGLAVRELMMDVPVARKKR